MSQQFFKGRLPVPPGINRSYQIVYVSGHPRIADTPAAAAFKQEAELRLTQQREFVRWDTVQSIRDYAEVKVYIPLKVEITYYFQTMWKRDVDGGDKAVIDAVFKYLHLNDSLVVDLHATKQVNRQDPHVEIELSIVQK